MAATGNVGFFDSAEKIQTLRTMWAAGHSTMTIARHFGVSKNVIIGKAHRMDLDARPSPIRRDASSPAAIPSAPRATMTLPPLPSEAQAGGIARMAGSGYRMAVIAEAMKLDVRAVLAVVPRPAAVKPVIVAPKPLPVSLVPVMREPPVLARRTCEWLSGDRPKTFVRCTSQAVRGISWCECHSRIVFVQHRRQAAAA